MKSILKTAAGTALGVLGATIISGGLLAVCTKPIMDWYFEKSVEMEKLDVLLEDDED